MSDLSRLIGTNITSPIVPGDDSDDFPTHIDIYGKGGYRAVDSSADVYGISPQRISLGMMVHSKDDGRFWIYRTGVYGSENWELLPFQAGDGRLDPDRIVYTTGYQIIEGAKTFQSIEGTEFYGTVRAATGLYKNLLVLGDFINYGPRQRRFGSVCYDDWCKVPLEELNQYWMPFDPARNISGTRRGYSELGRDTVRIGDGAVLGSKYKIFSIWAGRTGIGFNGEGFEVPYSSRDISASFNKPSASTYHRIRGVEARNLQEITFDDTVDTIDQINQEMSTSEVLSGISGVLVSSSYNLGGDGGSPENVLGIRVLMLFTSNAPYIKIRDDYARKRRLFRAVEKNSSWPSGFNLAWNPYPPNLYQYEIFIPDYQLLTGTGLGLNGISDFKIISNDTGVYRTSGLYNIKEKITWNLFFSGAILGNRGDYNIDPWTGQSDTEIYPILKRYCGTSDKESLTADEITGLLSGQFNFDPKQINNSAKTFKPTGEYIYFSWPADSGFNNIDFFRNYSSSKVIQTVPNGYEFFIDGEKTDFQISTVTGVKNKFNNEEDYYLFRSPWPYNRSEQMKIEVRPENF
jgi:hypothetical protein